MDVLMPQLGETVAEGKITQWFKSAGDQVKPGDNLFEIETDKVSMEVPSTTSGVLAEIRVPAGAVAPVGAVVGVIADGAGAAVSSTARATENRPPPRAADPASRRDAAAAAPSAEQGPRAALDPFFEVHTPERNYGPARLPGGATVTPLARRLAGEAGIDVSQLRGSGPRGRVTSPPPRRPQAQRRPRHCLGRAPPRSRRCLSPEVFRKCCSTACAAPLLLD